MALNFVVILTDDQGRWAMPHRMPELHMPNLQAMLPDALELNQFYCASPVCSPARSSLLTGRMPSAHGVHDWLVGGRHPEAKPDLFLDGQPTTPEVLADAGYQCAMSGKWHMGDSRRPASGFEFWYAHRYGGGPYFNAPIWRDEEPAEEERYFTHAVTQEGLRFLRERDASRPFYLQLNYTAPHDPWINNHPAEYLDLYADEKFPSVPRAPRHPWTLPRKEAFEDAFADPQPRLAGYCASLTAVDEGLGEVLAELEAQGVTDHTVVIYMADNGFSCGHHGLWGKGNGTWPLNFWDNSVRVPFVVKLPGGATGVSETLVSATSLHPTICELAGTQAPQDRWAAGPSVAPLLRGEEYRGPDAVVVAHSEYGGARMITDGRWKLVLRHQGPTELYDREADPDEWDNLADRPEWAEKQAELAGQLRDWFAHHERAGVSAWEQPVTGFGQIHPVSRGRSPQDSYAGQTYDGVRQP